MRSNGELFVSENSSGLSDDGKVVEEDGSQELRVHQVYYNMPKVCKGSTKVAGGKRKQNGGAKSKKKEDVDTDGGKRKIRKRRCFYDGIYTMAEVREIIVKSLLGGRKKTMLGIRYELDRRGMSISRVVLGRLIRAMKETKYIDYAKGKYFLSESTRKPQIYAKESSDSWLDYKVTISKPKNSSKKSSKKSKKKTAKSKKSKVKSKKQQKRKKSNLRRSKGRRSSMTLADKKQVVVQPKKSKKLNKTKAPKKSVKSKKSKKQTKPVVPSKGRRRSSCSKCGAVMKGCVAKKPSKKKSSKVNLPKSMLPTQKFHGTQSRISCSYELLALPPDEVIKE